MGGDFGKNTKCVTFIPQSGWQRKLPNFAYFFLFFVGNEFFLEGKSALEKLVAEKEEVEKGSGMKVRGNEATKYCCKR
ncbi:hypothetical protein SAMN05443429_10211 [Cruoricaptor ignavus]|uniref:Uncharacterized protein n=1 Tax=Cruoricaptor ignavus TaxID=1118202 RepID=A0A1M6BHZ0_9FLAO|nr:hypothetical protein [Cruoricaptor ignavus]SHI48329.1 hypothetical protein SAMN05443429_10211 [Cruoricaptor ignavus]